MPRLEFISQRRADDLPSSCPTTEDNCVYSCLAAGFTVELRLRGVGWHTGQTYADWTRLVSAYQEADCDCRAVFASPPEDDPRLLCTVPPQPPLAHHHP
eukprot:3312606-Rhodomonas_salina.1